VDHVSRAFFFLTDQNSGGEFRRKKTKAAPQCKNQKCAGDAARLFASSKRRECEKKSQGFLGGEEKEDGTNRHALQRLWGGMHSRGKEEGPKSSRLPRKSGVLLIRAVEGRKGPRENALI